MINMITIKNNRLARAIIIKIRRKFVGRIRLIVEENRIDFEVVVDDESERFSYSCLKMVNV